MGIARRQRAKQGLSDMAELLGDLKAAVARTVELRCVLSYPYPLELDNGRSGGGRSALRTSVDGVVQCVSPV